MSKLGKRLINAAKSAQAIAKGEADPKTYRVHVPAHLDVRAIRTKLKMSQNAFASLRHLAIHEQALPAHHWPHRLGSKADISLNLIRYGRTYQRAQVPGGRR
jgi:hypothetical protein